MSATVQADFNCPYSHLAGEQADLLSRSGVAVDLRGGWARPAPRLSAAARHRRACGISPSSLAFSGQPSRPGTRRAPATGTSTCQWL